MTITLNGERREVAQGATVLDVLRTAGLDPARPGIAVALDGTVIPRDAWGGTAVPPGSDMEIIHAVQGG